ncbi:MAG: PorP/SprF family type IX secretion system membrane protein [Bacteroidetes bacterium]|nr:PorP/SprF family type IX secretion system membrane protein [Bacteroidota bacterium]
MKLLIVALATLFTIGVSYSQQLPLGSLYYANMISMNPAFVGYKSDMEVFIAHRNQFVGFENSPKTNYASLTGRLSSQHRVGLTAFSDATALFTKSIINGNYGYSLQFGSQQQLVFALGAGLSTLDLNLSNGKAVDMNDQVYSSIRQTKAGFNADFGLLYEFRDLQVGFSIPQLFNNATNFELENNKLYSYKNTSHMRGTMKYDFSVGGQGIITASPMVMVRSVKGAPLQYDLSAILDHRDWGWIGVTYHSDFAVAASVGFRYKNFTFGYAHDFIMSDLQRFGKYSSEIVLGYTFDKRKPNAPKQDLTNILDPNAKKAEELNNGAPTDEELALMRQEIEKNRREKMMLADSIQKANTQAEEKKLIAESEQIAENKVEVKSEEPVEEKTKVEEKVKNEEPKKVVEAKVEAEVKSEEPEKVVEAKVEAEVKNEEPQKVVETKVEVKSEEPIAEKAKVEEKVKNQETKTKDQEPIVRDQQSADKTVEVNEKTPLVFDDATNFKLDNGNVPEEGFYIILGAFGDHNNTVRFMKTLRMNGIEDAFIVKNEVKNLEQVCVYFTGQIGSARNELMKFREEGRKSWILNLK